MRLQQLQVSIRNYEYELTKLEQDRVEIASRLVELEAQTWILVFWKDQSY